MIFAEPGSVDPGASGGIATSATGAPLSTSVVAAVQAAGGAATGAAAGAAVQSESDANEYAERLTKLFPLEGVTLFPMAVGIAAADEALLLGLVLLIAVVVGVLRWLGTQEPGGGSPRWLAVIVSVFAFLLYAFTLGGFEVFFGEDGQQQRILISSFITVIFTSVLGRMDFALPRDQN